MKRTQSKIGASLFRQMHILSDHIHDIISGTHFFNYIIRKIWHAACPPFVLVSVYLPGLRQEVFAEFGDGILVGHTRNVIADHALRLFPFIKHGEVFFRQKLNVVFVGSLP